MSLGDSAILEDDFSGINRPVSLIAETSGSISQALYALMPLGE